MKSWILALAALGVAGAAAAQQHQHQHSPYVGLESRQIKALADSQIQQLQDGEGMSLALAAELNHYPGPRHVVDLAQELGLTRQQQRRAQTLVDAHQPAARALGDSIITLERELDRGFAGRAMTDGRLRQLTAEIARMQGDLRYLHLAAHLALRQVLNDQQVRKYDELRGYSQAAPR